MFRKTNEQKVKEKLEADVPKYFDEIEELEDLSFEDDTEYFLSDDCLLILSAERVRLYYIAVPLGENFDLAALEKFINKRSDSFLVHLNVTGIEAGKLRFQEPYDVSDVYHSYYTDEDLSLRNDDDFELPGLIRQLTAEDKRYVDSFPNEGDIPGMKLKETFNIFIKDEIGSILGFFDREGQLLGYLSYMPSLLEAYSIDGIYVRPKYRQQGVGARLAREASRLAKLDNQACYWPVAQTEIVEQTAEAAGFKQVSSRLTFESL